MDLVGYICMLIGIFWIFESKMDANHTIDTIANTTFRAGKIVYENSSDTLKVYFQMMTQMFLLKRGLVLTYPERCVECENRSCLALTCFLVIKNFGSLDLSSVPPEICGCAFKHSPLWVAKAETKLMNIIKGDRALQLAIRDVVGKLEAMELIAHDSALLRTAYCVQGKNFQQVSLPQFEREDVFHAPQTGKASSHRVETKAVEQRRREEPVRPRPHSEAKVTGVHSWSHVASVPTFDKESIIAAAAASESKAERLRKLLAEEEERLAGLSDVQSELDRKVKADKESAELEAKIAAVRARINDTTGLAAAMPIRNIFPRTAPVIVGRKNVMPSSPTQVAPSAPQEEVKMDGENSDSEKKE